MDAERSLILERDVDDTWKGFGDDGGSCECGLKIRYGEKPEVRGVDLRGHCSLVMPWPIRGAALDGDLDV